ncbi:MAG: transcriptional activator RfaH [Phenylobacterium sp.]
MENVTSERRWYVVKTLPRREIFAAQQLANQGFTTFLPKQMKTVRHARKVQTALAAFFPSYLFVEFDAGRDRWRSINGTYGVSHLVTQAERPIPAPLGVIEDLIAASDARGVLTEGPWLEAGQQVRITHGPFADHLAVIERLGNADGVRVLLEIMGVETPVEARREHLIAAA